MVLYGSFQHSKFMYCVDFAENALFSSFGVVNLPMLSFLTFDTLPSIYTYSHNTSGAYIVCMF